MSAPSPEHAAAWDQLIKDARAFLAQHAGPEPVARLVWEAAVLGYVHGTRHAAGRSFEEQRADFPKDSQIVAGLLGHVTVDVERWEALRALALADFRAHRTEETADA